MQTREVILMSPGQPRNARSVVATHTQTLVQLRVSNFRLSQDGVGLLPRTIVPRTLSGVSRITSIAPTVLRRILPRRGTRVFLGELCPHGTFLPDV